MNFENKIVLSILIRIHAERSMIGKIDVLGSYDDRDDFVSV